ncbi:MAG: hypothetical protein PHC28_03685 [Flavobacterium sp.]|uniref:hypothetical protein n=1 Tax=Flavobacterium sp. TaxID=239 RepID=UPI0026234BD3|nr:hypothetical protein [Flavobacterium sp.]MDD5149567.1 hypothetical protein [Flavobacterium sp.]
MKKIVLYFLLMSFVFQSTSNLWIISSFYINQDYIAKNLCVNRFDKIPVCYGKCFLAKQLKENNKQEQKIPNVKEKEIQLYFYTQNTLQFDRKITADKANKAIITKDFNITNTFLYSIFHPPKMT